jgi:hypothetical protein
MSTGDREQFSTALGLSAAVNVALFLGIAWAMAVSQGLFPASKQPVAESPPAVQELIITAEATPPAPSMALPEPAPAPPKNERGGPDGVLQELRRQYITAPGEAPEEAPGDPATTLISSRNLRAASRIKGNPDGQTNSPTLQGSHDLPQLDLRNAEFINGDAKSQAPPAPGLTMSMPSPGLASNASLSVPAQTGSEPAENQADSPPEAAPLAFRDDSASSSVAASPQATPKPNSTPLNRDSTPGPPSAAARPGGIQVRQRIGKVNGKTITEGADSVDAVKTPEAAYAKTIKQTFDSIQQTRQQQVKDLVIRGSIVVIYELDTLGRISNVRLANPGVTNAIMQDLSITTIMSAKLPPPPMELFQNPSLVVPGNRLRLTYTFHYL